MIKFFNDIEVGDYVSFTVILISMNNIEMAGKAASCRDKRYGQIFVHLNVGMNFGHRILPTDYIDDNIANKYYYLLNTPDFIIKEHIKQIKSNPINNGMSCVQCAEHYHMAEPNRKDGSLVCYGCRKAYNWKYSEEGFK